MKSIGFCRIQSRPFRETSKVRRIQRRTRIRKRSVRPLKASLDATDRVVIIGGGVAGLSTALALTKVIFQTKQQNFKTFWISVTSQ